MQRLIRSILILTTVMLVPSAARAEFQVKPFAAITFGGGTTLISDLDHQAGSPKVNLGVSAVWLGEVIGLEGDVGTTPGFFTGTGADPLILRSHVATVTGNVIVAVPKRVAQYGLRPYGVAGFGLMDVNIFDGRQLLPFSKTLAAWDFGGGVTGFLNEHVGLNWDLRMFRSLGGDDVGFSLGPEQLTFWRASMGLAIRL